MRRRSSRYEGDDLRRLAAAGITSGARGAGAGHHSGQSALINITAPPDPSETSALATYRRGTVVVRLRRRPARRLSTGRRRWQAAVAAAAIPARCSA